jgi:hypothetical protein
MMRAMRKMEARPQPRRLGSRITPSNANGRQFGLSLKRACRRLGRCATRAGVLALIICVVREVPHWWHAACRSPEGGQRLVNAAAVGDLAEVRRGLDRGVPPDAVDDDGGGYCALILTDNLEVARLLLARGADPCRITMSATPLTSATLRGRLELMRILLDAGADPNQQVGRGHTALDMARLSSFEAGEKLLREHGALD